MMVLFLTCDKLHDLFVPEILTCLRFHPGNPLRAEGLVSGCAELLGLDAVEKVETRIKRLHESSQAGYGHIHKRALIWWDFPDKTTSDFRK